MRHDDWEHGPEQQTDDRNLIYAMQEPISIECEGRERGTRTAIAFSMIEGTNQIVSSRLEQHCVNTRMQVRVCMCDIPNGEYRVDVYDPLFADPFIEPDQCYAS